MVGGALGVFTVGLVVLCFVGVRSLHVTVLASGFALGWQLAEGSGAGLGTSVIVAVAVALGAWGVASFIFHAAPLFVGAVAGAVVRGRLFSLLMHGQGSVVVAMLFILAVALIAELATHRFQSAVLASACALAGAGLALSGLPRASPETLGLLRIPSTAREAVTSAVAWLALAAAGWVVQHRGTRGRRS